MKKIKSIQLKAAFLMIVFALNTVVGFGCAIGMDMGFNSNHHQKEVTDIPIRLHADGKRHHSEVKNHHEASDNDLNKTTNEENNCCHDKVTKIAQQDKAIAPSISLVSPVFFTALISSFYNANLLSNGVDSHIKYFLRSHRPTIPDIRIAIQSFQI